MRTDDGDAFLERILNQVRFIDDPDQPSDMQEGEEKDSSSVAGKEGRLLLDHHDHQSLLFLESDNLLEDLQIPDSRLIDGDAAELALIGKFRTGPLAILHNAFILLQIRALLKNCTKLRNVC